MSATHDFPLAPMQQGLLFDHLSADRTGVYVEQIVGELPEAVDPDLFSKAWERVQRRHEPLRAAFDWEDRDAPRQLIHTDAPIPTTFHDWSELEPEARAAELADYLERDRRRGFDLTQAPPMRLLLVREGSRLHRFVWSFHHILLDGRSFPVILEEVLTALAALRDGAEPNLPSVIPYHRYVAWIAERDWASSTPFWRDLLAGFHGPTPIVAACASGITGPVGRGERTVTLSCQETEALENLAADAGARLSTLVSAGWGLLLSRYTGEDDVVFGVTRACRRFSLPDPEHMAGLFINTLPVRIATGQREPVRDWLAGIRQQQIDVRDHEHTPLATVQACAPLGRGTRLFDSVVIFDLQTLDSRLRSLGGAWEARSFELHEQTDFPLTLYAWGESELVLKLAFDRPAFSDEIADRMLQHLKTLLQEAAAHPALLPRDLSMLGPEERRRYLVEFNDTTGDWPRDSSVHDVVARRAATCPDSVALIHRGRRLDYRELEERATALAARLVRAGIEPGDRVAVFLPRAPEMVVGILGILKAGAAYVPIDPDHPDERIATILDDCRAAAVVTRGNLAARLAGRDLPRVPVDGLDKESPSAPVGVDVRPDDLAYVMYTSGSTGMPKGVMVEHRNVVSFFAAMDEVVEETTSPMVWLAVTGLSFDISVLELLWTLTRGATVVLSDEPGAENVAPEPVARPPAHLSLFYFASDEALSGDKYELLMEGARFADRHGFHAVWTPERHFHRFGGLYPNPALTSAAVAAVTERIRIRAGSVVAPLHHPLRVAEDWALVDNLSGGRVGISLASGWQPRDFVLQPDAYATRKERLIEIASVLRRLWRGESVAFPGPEGDDIAVRTLPRPVQSELPLWITAAGNPDTFRLAGELGAGVLTHLLGQTVEELRAKIDIYKEAWRAHPEGGGTAADGEVGAQPTVTLMLHTFLGEDEDAVRRIVREPMKTYLRGAMSLVKAAAWSFPAFRRRVEGGGEDVDAAMAEMGEDELDALLEHSFERYFETAGLFGTVDRARATIDELVAAGVDEIACLIDFGVPVPDALASLERLRELRSELSGEASVRRDERPWSVAELIRVHGVTHLQCTPSAMRLFLGEPDSREALGSVPNLLVGGEAMSAELATELRAAAGPEATIANMYGPTETTIWSSTYRVRGDEASVPIGQPIRNTRMYVLDAELRPVPADVTGELYIGGPGVARGYLDRPRMTRERFVPDPFNEGGRLYRTGDLVSRRPDGVIEFRGRIDRQVKVLGHRIELGEIEAVLDGHPGVEASAVHLPKDDDGQTRLVAYFVSSTGAPPSASELRRHLADRLPRHMLPAAFVRLERFPLTPNRKVDYNALPSPDRGAYVRPESESTRAPSPTETRLLAIWQSVLGIDEIETDDNFFELGGDSILAIQIVGRCRRSGLRLSVRDLLEHQTIAGLAAVTAPSATPTEAAPDVSDAPLAPAQIWFLDQDQPHPGRYAQVMAVEPRRPLDAGRLRRAIDALVSHHGMLRVRLERNESGHRRLTQASDEPASLLEQIDLSGTDVEPVDVEQAAIVDRLLADLDLDGGPVLGARHLLLPDKAERLVIAIHHLAVDGVSWRILLGDLEQVYRQLENGDELELPVASTSFLTWARRLADHAEAISEAEVAHWRSVAEAHSPPLPRDIADGHNAEASREVVVAELDADETARLLTEAPALRAEVPEILLSAFARVLCGWTGGSSLLLDLEGHGREELFPELDLSRAVGWFTSIFPVHLDVDGDALDTLQRVADRLHAVPDKGVGYGVLRYHGRPEVVDALARCRPEVQFNYLGQFDGLFPSDGMLRPATGPLGPFSRIGDPSQRRPYVLEVVGIVADGRLRIAWEYSRNLHRASTIETLASRFVDELRTLLHLAPEHGRELEPADFPHADLSRADLERVLSQVADDRVH